MFTSLNSRQKYSRFNTANTDTEVIPGYKVQAITLLHFSSSFMQLISLFSEQSFMLILSVLPLLIAASKYFL